ncbi:MAG: peptide ABC transporter ATP-binding protein [Planctomycetota bacterium]|nr:MAG: peptide ABC transporter ATP-binding protein [Planctomycetota bacterium]
MLTIENLSVEFASDHGPVRAVSDVSLALAAGETLGLVGESGSGKSVTSLAIMGLVPQPPGRVTGGRVLYRGEDLLRQSAKRLAELRGRRIAMIFQDPMTALNPFLSVGEQLAEVTRHHLRHTRRHALDHAVEMLAKVGIPSAARRVFDYPHQFSGGMRQRAMIAMALSCRPDVLIADEPTTALDVTIQAQILELLAELQRREGTAILLITHDLGVVAKLCRRVAVMYAGRIVEEAPVESLFAAPMHPYTRGLLESVPRLPEPGEPSAARLVSIEGQPPDLAELPPGCAFEPRCRFREGRCAETRPALQSIDEQRRHACLVDIASR